ncbi:MAG: hypothetical protein ACTSUQ_09195 [Candidatus Freyarchaeota archaeon]
MKRHAEELKAWLTKWYGVRLGVITGYIFVDTDELEEFLEVLESDPGRAHGKCVFRGPLLDPMNSLPVIKLLSLLVGKVVSPLIYKSGLSCILVLDFDGERFCCVCDGRERWVCVFRTKEKNTKALIAHMFSLLGFEERSYRYTGLRVYRKGFSEWLKRSIDSGLLDYVWIRNGAEKGETPSREPNLIAKTIQNWFEDKTFSSSVFTWWLSGGKIGIWGLNYADRITCVFSASGRESENREVAEVLGEVYDAYRSGIQLEEREPEEEALGEAGFTDERFEYETGPSQAGGETGGEQVGPLASRVETVADEFPEVGEKVRPFNLFGKRLMELEQRVRNLERELGRVRVVEDKVGQMEVRISNSGIIEGEGLEEALKLLEKKTSVIEDMMEEIRSNLSVLNESLTEFKRRGIEILRAINEYRGSK